MCFHDWTGTKLPNWVSGEQLSQILQIPTTPAQAETNTATVVPRTELPITPERIRTCPVRHSSEQVSQLGWVIGNTNNSTRSMKLDRNLGSRTCQTEILVTIFSSIVWNMGYLVQILLPCAASTKSRHSYGNLLVTNELRIWLIDDYRKVERTSHCESEGRRKKAGKGSDSVVHFMTLPRSISRKSQNEMSISIQARLHRYLIVQDLNTWYMFTAERNGAYNAKTFGLPFSASEDSSLKNLDNRNKIDTIAKTTSAHITHYAHKEMIWTLGRLPYFG